MRIWIFLLAGLASCNVPNANNQPLPVIGNREIVDGDTIYHTVPDFAFMNQDSQWVTNETFAGKAYVVDFFFTHCPTICPKVAKQMKRVHDRFLEEDRLLLLAHSIDPKRDTIGRLKWYAGNLGVESSKWHFVTGDKDSIYAIADDYFSIAIENPDSPGGFDHSGRLILIDPQRRVRSFCDGTDAKSVDKFMLDIDKLLREMQ
ncbi:MAG: SCO family protein [Saprospirales bacterium]|nr:SCO family protein [Saprospirales bacterium]